MSQVLLVGIDCSECSDRALDYAVRLAGKSKVQLIVLHVIEWSPFTFNTPQENEERHKRYEEEIARAHRETIDPVIARLKSEGLDIEGIVQHGHAAATLNRVANERNATNIIIGRKGASRLKTHLFGSVAGTLVQISEHPVTGCSLKLPPAPYQSLSRR